MAGGVLLLRCLGRCRCCGDRACRGTGGRNDGRDTRSGAGREGDCEATVQAVDLATRDVAPRRADGEGVRVVAGPEVRNLARVEMG